MKFLREVQQWNLSGLKAKEVAVLVGLIENVYNYFKEDRRLNGQILSSNMGENIFGKTTEKTRDGANGR